MQTPLHVSTKDFFNTASKFHDQEFFNILKSSTSSFIIHALSRRAFWLLLLWLSLVLTMSYHLWLALAQLCWMVRGQTIWLCIAKFA